MYLWGVVSGGLFVLAAMVEQFLFGFDRSEFLVLRNEGRWFEGASQHPAVPSICRLFEGGIFFGLGIRTLPFALKVSYSVQFVVLAFEVY